MVRRQFGGSVAAVALAACAVIGSGAAVAAAPAKVRVIVAFKPGTAALVRQSVHAGRGQVAEEIVGEDAMAIEVPPQALAGLARNPNVQYVEEDAIRRPLATGWTPSTGAPYALNQKVPYGIKMVQADQLADTLASNRKLCIIDSGYDRAHEDLAKGANVTGEYDRVSGWWYTDEDGHGTHVAGTIAALNAAGTGVVGVLPNQQLKLHIVKVFNAKGWAYSSTLASAANKCKAAGANVISMSLGGPSGTRTEQSTFDKLYSGGVLSIAAAGNDGNTALSYPAAYASVVSVGAVDEAGNWGSFSQYNSKVEIAGPGVAVLSTVPMGSGRESALSVAGTAYAPGGMEGSPTGSVSAPLADFGIGDAVNPAVSGKVCLIQRGSIAFGDKVLNCQTSGGVGAVVYNNVAGEFGGTLGTTATSIPSMTVSDAAGAQLLGQLGQTAVLAVTGADYAFFDGTSMATPHVSAVAALVWSRNLNCTAAQLRASLNASAKDLNAAGRDVYTGFGLVQAKAADDRIKARGCGK